MRVSDVRVAASDDACELRGWVESDANPDETDWFAPFPLWWRFPGCVQPFLSADNCDPFLAALLLPAMRLGEPLHLPAPVSPRLLETLPDIQAIFAVFDPRTTHVEIEATSRAEPLPGDGSPPRAGLFFSMGVDSSYSLLKNLRDHPADDKRVTHLIAVHGFDVAHDGWDETFPPLLLGGFARVACETGKALLPVVTNVRDVGARLAPWTMLHGPAMASIALALGTGLRRVTIAASTTYDLLYPWGTHPVLDPRWSTEGLTVVHDGCEMSTIDKTRFVAHSPLVLATLRVCPGYGSGYNCGRCMKCLRTVIDLMQAGLLEASETLPHQIDAETLRIALRMPGGPVHRENFRRRLETFAAAGTRPDLQAVIREHLDALEGTTGTPAPAAPGRLRRLFRR